MVQDVIILQNENKVKAALGQKVKVNLPKAYQTSKVQYKSLALKGIPTDITEMEFKKFLDLNKITYAKAERLKSKKDGRVLPIFRLEITDPTEAEVLVSQNVVCQVTGIVYKVEEFRSQFRLCNVTTVNVSVTRQKHVGISKNASSAVRIILKGCPNRGSRNPRVQTVRDHMLLHIKDVQNKKKNRRSDMWSTTKSLMDMPQ